VRRPQLSWFPVRHLVDEVDGVGVGEAWIDQAASFGFSYVEVHELYVRTREQERSVRSRLERAGAGISQLTCAPDFVNPDADVRRRELESMREKVGIAARLGAKKVRVTAGIARPELGAEDAVAWASELLRELASTAEHVGVVLCLENHFRDRTWPADAVDVTLAPDRFMTVVDTLRDSPVVVNFDTAQTMLSGADPVELLTQVEDRVRNLHAGDRRRGRREHAVIGEGDVDFEGVLGRLARCGYEGFVTVEDGSAAGDEGLRRAVAFLEAKIESCWMATV